LSELAETPDDDVKCRASCRDREAVGGGESSERIIVVTAAPAGAATTIQQPPCLRELQLNNDVLVVFVYVTLNLPFLD